MFEILNTFERAIGIVIILGGAIAVACGVGALMIWADNKLDGR